MLEIKGLTIGDENVLVGYGIDLWTYNSWRIQNRETFTAYKKRIIDNFSLIERGDIGAILLFENNKIARFNNGSWEVIEQLIVINSYINNKIVEKKFFNKQEILKEKQFSVEFSKNYKGPIKVKFT